MRGPRRRDSRRLIAAYLLAALLAVGFVWAEAERTAAQPLGGAFLFPEGPSPAGGMQFGMHLGETPGVFRWHAPLAAGVRAGAVPLEFRWDVVEPAPGRFEWTRYDQAVDALQAHGLHVVGVLHYPADLPPPGRASRAGWPSAHVDDWDYFVHRVVSRYGGEIRDWVVVRGRAGAPDPLFGAAEADVDVQLIRIAAAALRRALPGARLWAVAPGADLRWLELFMARGGLAAVDGLALDVNRWPAGPEGLERVVADVRALAARAGSSPLLWVWRFGYPTHTGLSTSEPKRPGVSRAEQAAFVVKAHAVLWSAGVSAVFWNELVDRSPDVSDARANFGLYESVGRGKPAAFAYATMTRMLSGLRYGAGDAGWPSAPPRPTVSVVADGRGFGDEARDALDDGEEPVQDGGTTGPEEERPGDGAPFRDSETVGADPPLQPGLSTPEVIWFDAEAVAAEAAGRGVHIHAHPFSGGGRHVVVLWTAHRTGDGAAVLPHLDGLPVRVYDMFGRPTHALALGTEPIYVEVAMEILTP